MVLKNLLLDRCLTNPQGQAALAQFNLGYYFKPFQNALYGGDRFGCALTREGNLAWYIADATGHGEYGAKFWEQQAEIWNELWQQFLQKSNPPEAIYELARVFNEHLHQAILSHSTLQTCLGIGVWSPSGQLVFANFGYGTHILPQSSTNIWWMDQSDRIFGLKLGWLAPLQWANTPRAFILHEVLDIQRLILCTDSFLEDDYRDPQQTLSMVKNMSHTSQSLSFNAIIPYFLQHFPHEEDDTTLVVIELNQGSAKKSL